MFDSLIFTDKDQAAPEHPMAELLWVRSARSFQLEPHESYYGDKQPEELLVFALQKGELNVESDFLHGIVGSGQVFFLPQQTRDCSLTARQDSEGIVFALAGSLLERILGEHIREQRLYCPHGLPGILDAAAALQSEAMYPEQNSALAYRLLMELYRMAERYEGKPGYPPLVEAAMGIIQEEFAQLDGVSEVAERLGVSENHLIRLFSQHVGISPGRCLRKRRMHYARELLAHSDLPVSLIAELTGFAEANYFSKVFRRETGLSPSEYARQYAQTEAIEPSVRRRMDELYL
ncbi:MAG: helix-turn-helix domain-containing protein [Eubacteriales bacterium]|nr:helix-turn-helix domain-containing protein [Eubacteriales bacterium]